MLLNVKIEKMEMHNEEVMDIDHDSKAIRLDVYIKDINKMYDIELQTTDTKELPERCRFYQSVMDLDSLKKGDFYKELKDSYVIFICLEDIFQKGLPVYAFENGRIKGDQERAFEDARNLYKNGVSVDIIAKSLGMTLEQIKEIVSDVEVTA